MCILCYFSVIVFKNVLLVFPINIDIYVFYVTTRNPPTSMRRKINNIIHSKDILNPSPHCINGTTFKWFSWGDNELVCGQLGS